MACLKACYSTRKEAKAALRLLKKRRTGVTTFYYCDTCSYYHLTSMPKQASRKLSRQKKK